MMELNGDLDGTFEIKTWEEMIEYCDMYDEKYKEIHFPSESYSNEMENDMPEDRIIKVEKGYWWPKSGTNWHITKEMIKREISQAQ